MVMIVQRTKLKPGYKQTEVGVIPVDWEVRALESLTSEIGDGIHSTPQYVKISDFFFINGNNLFGNEIKITAETKFVSEKEYNKYKKKLSDKTILLSINGTIGNIALFNGEKVILGKSACYININASADKTFIFYSLQNTTTKNFFKNELTGSTINNLSLKSIRNIPVPLPAAKSEQTAIAAALSDVDALITSLDKLIAKKRDIKQATIQQLLTGKTRLPGFGGGPKSGYKQTEVGMIPEDWEPTPLGLFSAFITKGATPTTYGFSWVDDGVLFLRSECVSEQGLDLTQSMFITPEAHNILKRGEVCAGDILITITGNVGRVIYLSNDFGIANINQHIARIRIIDPDVDADYVFHFLSQSTVRKYYSTITTGQAYPQISLKQVRDTRVPIPPTKSEQRAIATVLSDMDAEIAALEQKRDKTRALKQGMMQELLTGKTRLV